MRRTLIALIVGAALIAGCGGGDDNGESAATPAATATQAPADDNGGGGATETVKFSAPSDGSLKFDQGDVTAKAGKVTVDFANPSSVPHAVEIEGNGVEKAGDVVTGGDTSFSVDLKPGEYTYYCPVGSHRDQGMEGTLTVQ